MLLTRDLLSGWKFPGEKAPDPSAAAEPRASGWTADRLPPVSIRRCLFSDGLPSAYSGQAPPRISLPTSLPASITTCFTRSRFQV